MRTFTKDTALSEQGRGAAWQGRGVAWTRHAMCESAFTVGTQPTQPLPLLSLQSAPHDAALLRLALVIHAWKIPDSCCQNVMLQPSTQRDFFGATVCGTRRITRHPDSTLMSITFQISSHYPLGFLRKLDETKTVTSCLQVA